MRTGIAVVVGFIVWTVLWLGTNAALAGALPDRFADDGSTSDVTILVLILILSAVFSFISGWLTAKVAKAADNRPATILGVVLLLVGIAVQIGYWDLMPIWYHLVFLALLFPVAVAGGRQGMSTAN